MIEEHLIRGEPITRLEALALYGVQNLTVEITRIRRDGLNVRSRKVTFAEAARRLNKYAAYTPPQNLPISEILLTDYWLSK